MMYRHSNNEIDKRINVSKIANSISTMGDELELHTSWTGVGAHLQVVNGNVAQTGSTAHANKLHLHTHTHIHTHTHTHTLGILSLSTYPRRIIV